MDSYEWKYTVRILRFDGTRIDHFHLWWPRLNAALTGRRIAKWLTSDTVTAEINEKELPLITSAVGNRSLCAIQNFSTAKYAWENLQVKYAAKTLVNKLGVRNSLLNLKIKREEQIGDQTANRETKLSKLVTMSDHVIESIQAPMSVYSLSNLPNYTAITASVNTVKENRASLNSESVEFIQGKIKTQK